MKNFTKKLAILCLSLATCATVGATAGCERIEGIMTGLGGAYEELTHQHEYTMDKHNATEHWDECECGEKANVEAHKGGTATCTEQAKCTVCGTSYGKLKAHSYLLLKNDAKNHWYECACGAKDKVEGHKGGTATYNKQAECTVCGEAYGAFADAQPYTLTINNYAPLTDNSTYTETILEGATVETQAPQNQEGLTFLYFVDEAGEVVNALPETMPSADLTLTAVWEAKTYTVTISYPEETGVEATVIQFAAFENEGIVALEDIAEVVEAAIADETEDYTFAWAEKLPAEYELKNYEFNVAATNKKATLTIENYYPLAKEADLSVKILKGATIEVAPVEVPTGYKFLGFMNAEGEMVDIPETMPEEDLTVEAVWESTTYTVTVNYPAEAEKETTVIAFALTPEWAEDDSVVAPEELAALIKAAVPAANKAFTFALTEELPAEFGPQDYEFSVSYKVVSYKVTFSYPTGYYGTKQASVTFGVYTDTAKGVKYDVNTIAEFVAAWAETFPVQETFYEFTTVSADEIPKTFELQNYTFKVEQGKQIGWLDEKVTELVVGQPYKMSVYQGNKKQTLYSTGVLSGYYGASTQNFAAGATFYVEEAQGGYYLYFMKGATKTYVNLEQSGSYVNIKYQTTAKSVWTMNATYDTLTTKIGSTDYYMGTYNNFTTFSASKLSYAATSFVSNLYSAEVLNFDPATTKFDVIFNSNGGSEVETQSVLYNTPVNKPETNPTLAGMNFAGWYEDAECTVEYDFTKPVKGEMTLYAGWADVIYYEVNYVTNGGSAVAAEKVEEGNAFTKPEDPTNELYTFLGWYTDEDCTVAYDFATIPTSDVTLYAAWEAPTQEEIVNALYALTSGQSLKNKYTLTGVITSVDTAYSTQFSNVTVTMVVGDMTDKPIQCFRLAGTGANLIGKGDTITVTGVLKNYYGKQEFDQGCVLNSYTKHTCEEVTVLGKEATCTETGLTEGSKCALCDKVFVAQQVIEKKDHVYVNGKCECGAEEGAVAPAYETFTADFNSVSATNTSYTKVTTKSGWVSTNTAVFQGGTTNSSPTFKAIGTASDRGFALNGKTSGKGKLTSPTLTGGLSKLTFGYANVFSESNGVDLTVTIKQNGTTIATKKLDNNSVTQYTAYTFEWDLLDEGIAVTGEFTIEIANNSPSNSSKNKDRVCIFNLQWTNNPA